MADFRSLVVWQKSMTLAKEIYLLTQNFPTSERFGLIGQMRRCAVSIPSNIAEGSKRASKKDFALFLRIASGSAAELETQLLLASELFNIDATKRLDLLKEIQKMLESLAKRI